MRILLTGHTGFKGFWAFELLRQLGHEVFGFALEPEPGSLSDLEGSWSSSSEAIGDIRDLANLTARIRDVSPDVIFHMAAQSLVSRSHAIPVDTYWTNVAGTLNVLGAASQIGVQRCLVVTTDKVYGAAGSHSAQHKEDSPLTPSFDPYSKSKSHIDSMVQEIIEHSSEALGITVVRGGNVIGGGDTAENRLLPDLARAFHKSEVASVRNPDHTRPWQHVLDCLSGYVCALNHDMDAGVNGTWNVGPEGSLKVSEVCEIAVEEWADARWQTSGSLNVQENPTLELDSSKLREQTPWRPIYGPKESVRQAVSEYKSISTIGPKETVRESVTSYLAQALFLGK